MRRVYPRIIEELTPAAGHVFDRYAHNIVEADHGRLKARLRPMRGLKTIRSLRTLATGHAFVQNLRRARPRSRPGRVHRTRPMPMTTARPGRAATLSRINQRNSTILSLRANDDRGRHETHAS